METLRESMGKQPDPRIETVRSVHSALLQFTRNGRWGTCADCPTNTEGRYPEFCPNTNRSDHQLDIFGISDLFHRRLDELRQRAAEREIDSLTSPNP